MDSIKYEKFTVYRDSKKGKNIFIHIDMDSIKFHQNLLSYFFDENKLLQYIESKTNIKFVGKQEDFVKLYKKINDFIDKENTIVDIEALKKEVEFYIDWEYYSKENLLCLRRDKVGKVGEYIFHNILIDYFDSLCVIPKLNLVTNRNMSIYGIDIVFYDSNDNTLMFGESKVSISLEEGIKLANSSLKKYEYQIFEEYRIILSNNMANLPDSLSVYVNKCINFEKFIKKAQIDSICIPIFIMHGNEYKVKDIFEKMDKLEKTTVLNLKINYIIISLPILDKNRFQSCLIQFLRERSDYYESMSEQLSD